MARRKATWSREAEALAYCSSKQCKRVRACFQKGQGDNYKCLTCKRVFHLKSNIGSAYPTQKEHKVHTPAGSTTGRDVMRWKIG